MRKPEHQKDGGENIQNDHAGGVGQILFAQLGGGGVFSAVQQIKDSDPQSGAPIEERRHHHGIHLFQQYFGAGNIYRVKYRRQDGVENGNRFLSRGFIHGNRPLSFTFGSRKGLAKGLWFR